jgi:hypothetical protein
MVYHRPFLYQVNTNIILARHASEYPRVTSEQNSLPIPQRGSCLSFSSETGVVFARDSGYALERSSLTQVNSSDFTTLLPHSPFEQRSHRLP